MRRWPPIIVIGICLRLAGCMERLAEPTDVFEHIKRGDNYSPTSHMIDDWYAIEAIDDHPFAINEPLSFQSEFT